MGVIIGDVIVTDSGLVAAGNYKAGAVLGLAGGKLKLCDKNATDGSENPYAVLLEDVNSDTDRVAPILLLGEVDRGALSFGQNWSLDEIVVALRNIGIFAKGVVNG